MVGKRIDYLPITFEGLTPSGDTLTTTLGNTLRSIMYYRYALHRCGVLYEGPNAKAQIFAAGDDVVIFCDPSVADVITGQISRLTSRTGTQDSELG